MVILKNPKAKGSRNERRVIKFLKELGYDCTKAGGSLGIFDIIAVNRQDIRLIQVKSNRMPAPLEMETIRDFKNYPACGRKEVWVWHDYVKQPSIHILDS